MKKIFNIVMVFFIALQTNVNVIAANDSIGGNDTNVNLYPFEYNGKWGYIDKKGNVKIEPQYDEAYQFSNELALVRTGTEKYGSDYKYGYIDKEGNISIHIKYNHATSFVNGNAVAERHNYNEEYDEDGLWIKGYRYWINQKGKYFLKEKIYGGPAIDFASPFCEKLALRETGDLTNYIDKKGNSIIGPYDGGSSFCEGLAAVYSYMGDEVFKAGYINTKGEMVIAQKFDHAGDFSDGLAPVCIKDKWGFIDKQGKYQIVLTYQDARPFSEGIAAVKQNGKWGFIDKDNKFVIEPQYKNVDDCINGLIMVKDSKDRFLYYIDKNNKKIKPRI